ncbi:hypothetical protein, partial [Thermocatellispora tengchongensis]|uniref:hypothetical protein n=1 Tax=Thermocatellispora tengchongensis TaxID=1073253 RepID=UPI0031ED92E4
MGKAPDWSGLTSTGNGAGGPLSVVGPQDPAERQAVIDRLRAMLAGAPGNAQADGIEVDSIEADGTDSFIWAVREQMGRGADIIKVYADYRWGPNEPSRPTFSQEEL